MAVWSLVHYASPQDVVRRGKRSRGLQWRAFCQQGAWWTASARGSPGTSATARPAAPAWSEAAGPAGRARRSCTTAAVSSWAACSSSSASPSSPPSNPRRRRWWRRKRPKPAPSRSPESWPTARLQRHTKCPFCALTRCPSPGCPPQRHPREAHEANLYRENEMTFILWHSYVHMNSRYFEVSRAVYFAHCFLFSPSLFVFV